MQRLLRTATALALATASAVAAAQTGWSFDTGMDVHTTAHVLLDELAEKPPTGSWLRIRGVDAGPKTTPAAVQETRDDLARLKNAGYRIVALVMWSTDSWKKGVRSPVRENRLPSDLREAFERCRKLAATYGDVVNYWEIGNEPDISFVQENPETYTAYLKACYLGVEAGKADMLKTEKLKSEIPASAGPVRGSKSSDVSVSAFPKSASPNFSVSACQRVSVSSGRGLSRVLMAPLALPPGPYLEAFLANGGLSYTDGFNYHYYGYPEDFTGVYRQFEAALNAASEKLKLGQADKLKSEALNDQRSGSPNVSVSACQRVSVSGAAPSLWRSRFFPSADGWQGTTVATFNGTATDAQIDAAINRPRAGYEPPLHRQGRWLVTDGVTVEEANGVWRFTITNWPAGPLRAPAAELVLPAAFAAGETLKSGQADKLKSDAARETSDLAAEKLTSGKADKLKSGSNERGASVACTTGSMSEISACQRVSVSAFPAPACQNVSVSACQRVSISLLGSLLTFDYRRVNPTALTVPSMDKIDPVRNNRVVDDPHPPVQYPKSDASDFSVSACQRVSVSAFPARDLPVFLTEYGFGALDKVTRNTVEGRERQRAWFASVDQQIRDLGIEGAMAFVLSPYLERDQNEFGLLMTQEASSETLKSGQADKLKSDAARETSDLAAEKLTRGKADKLKSDQNSEMSACQHVSVSSPDVSVSASQRASVSDAPMSAFQRVSVSASQLVAAPPSQRAGVSDGPMSACQHVSVSAFQHIGSYVASPALTQILRDGTRPMTPHRWRVATPPPSDVVIDFIPGKGLGQAKSYGGYFLEHEAGRTFPAEGDLVVYNFSDKPISGELRLSGESWEFARNANSEKLTSGKADKLKSEADAQASESPHVRMSACQRVSVSAFPLVLRPGERRLIPVLISTHLTHFVAADVGATFTERPLTATELAEIDAQEKAAATARQPREGPEISASQRVSVSAFPSTPSGPLDMFECYLRTENGNLYQTWPRLLPTPNWQMYMQRIENFTMAFYGRAYEPWRLVRNAEKLKTDMLKSDQTSEMSACQRVSVSASPNSPSSYVSVSACQHVSVSPITSLVFFFHPDEFPVTYEVTPPQLRRFEAPEKR